MRILLINALLICGTLAINAQNRIQGEGDVVKQDIQLDEISGVHLGFHGDIYITQGSPQKITIEGQQNIIDNIKRDVRDGVWKVNFDKQVRNTKPVKIYITMATLTDAGVSGSGNLVAKGTFDNVKELDTYVSGSGDVELDVNAQTISSAISGSGGIELSGSANDISCSISGSGDIDAMNLRARSADISISGSGDVAVHVTDELKVAVSGSGDVKYKGDPSIVKSRVSGSGDVDQVN